LTVAINTPLSLIPTGYSLVLFVSGFVHNLDRSLCVVVVMNNRLVHDGMIHDDRFVDDGMVDDGMVDDGMVDDDWLPNDMSRTTGSNGRNADVSAYLETNHTIRASWAVSMDLSRKCRVRKKSNEGEQKNCLLHVEFFSFSRTFSF
jgi:hypothetical protein